MKEPVHTGKAWILTGSNGQLIEDIDTDQIFHNAFLHITEVDEMGKFTLGNLEGWKDFSKKADRGDIVVAGGNFGAGSSRQQAVDCFISLGIDVIVAPSFGAIYFRNAVNAGFPVMRCENLYNLVRSGHLQTGHEIRIDFCSGELWNRTKNITLSCQPMSEVQFKLYKAGGLFRYGRDLGRD